MKILFLSLWILLGAITVFAGPGGVPNGGVGRVMARAMNITMVRQLRCLD